MNYEFINYFDSRLRPLIKKAIDKRNDIQEIRLRVNKPIEILFNNESCFINAQGELIKTIGEAVIAEDNTIDSCINIMTNYSLYSMEDEIKNGFITLRGGYRIGIAGKVVLDNGKINTISDISGLNIRCKREVKGAADKVLPYLIKDSVLLNTLIVSPPQCGKTTLIRDIGRQVSNGIPKINFRGLKVGIVDERSEIAGSYKGIPENDIGVRTDILDACPKSQGIIMLIRSMSPEVILTDEIGTEEDLKSINLALCAGIKIVTTVHGQDLKDLLYRPVLSEIINNKVFDRLVFLGNKHGIGEIEDILDGKSLDSVYYRGCKKCG